jgi:hypothetical protein
MTKKGTTVQAYVSDCRRWVPGRVIARRGDSYLIRFGPKTLRRPPEGSRGDIRGHTELWCLTSEVRFTAPKKSKKPKCEAQTHLGCNGVAVRKVTGTKKGDPIFYCCLGCRAILSRQGVRLRDVQGAK